jgi:hypothetical protein
MKRLSTSATLILKLFFPVFWAVFFGSFTLAILFFQGGDPLIKNPYFKMGSLGFYLMGLLIIYFTLWQLRRVEVDEEAFYVTDYFKTIKIPFPLVLKVTENDYLLFSTLTLHLHKKGHFGKKITFVQSQQKVLDFLKNRPDMAVFFDQNP